MGQTTSLLTTNEAPCKGSSGSATVHPSMLGIVGLWLGALRDKEHLPSSWEELLAWTDLVSSWHLFRENSEMAEDESTDLLNDEYDDDRGLEFEAKVNVDMVDQIDRLPLLSWIDRAVFFHQHVRTPTTNENKRAEHH